MTEILALPSMLQKLIENSFADADPSKVFLHSGELPVLTYAELDVLSLKAISLLRNIGMKPQSRILIASKKEKYVSILLIAALRYGIIPIICDPESVPAEIYKTFEASDPSAIFLDSDLITSSFSMKLSVSKIPTFVVNPIDGGEISTAHKDLRKSLTNMTAILPMPSSTEDHVALIIYTSGTTSTPKGVELTHRNISAQMEMFDAVYGFVKDDHLLNLLPLHHVDGLVRGLLAALCAGATITRPRKFQITELPKILNKIKVSDITHLIVVPTILALMENVDEKYDKAFFRPNFKFIISSADLLNEELWKRFERRFNTIIVNSYGLSETVCDSLFCGPAANTRKIGTLGKPVGCEIRIIGADGKPVESEAIGELQIRGLHIMKGYFQQPEETKKSFVDGWFKTGDLVRTDTNGFVCFEGRLKTVIVSGGINIHPENINRVLLKHGNITEAASIGIPDEVWGQKVVACIVASPSNSMSEVEIIQYCRDNLSAEKIPHRVLPFDILPKVPSGKIDNKALMELTLSKLSEEIEEDGDTIPDVFEIAAKCFKLNSIDLTLESSPYNTAGWDSLAHITFIVELEGAFSIKFSPIDIINLNSLADVCDIVGQKY